MSAARRKRDARGQAERAVPGALRAASSLLVRHELILVLVVGLLALALRLAHVLELKSHDPYFALPTVDPRIYHEWALRIAGGDWLGEGLFWNSPLYPYFLGAVYSVLGSGFLVGRIANALLGTLVALLAWRLGRTLFDARVGLLAALWCATNPMLLFTGGELLSETLQSALNLAALLLVVAAARSPRSGLLLAAGAVLGLSVLTRPNVLLFAGAAAAWLWRLPAQRPSPWTSGARRAGLYLAGVALTILPLSLRNVAVTGQPVLMTTQGGWNFFLGNNPEANGRYHVPAFVPRAIADDPLEQARASRELASQRAGRELSAPESSAYWSEQALAFVFGSPFEWLRLELRKLSLLITSREVSDLRSFDTDRRYSWVTRLPFPGFSTIFSLGLLGLVAHARSWRGVGLLHVGLACSAAALLIVYVTSRYRVPALPLLIVAASAGTWWLLDRIAAKDNSRLIAGAALVLVASLVSISRGGPVDTPQAHFNLANKYRELGREEDAIVEYRVAVSMDSSYIAAQSNLALLLGKRPESRSEAVSLLQEVHRLSIAQHDEIHRERAEKWLARLGEAPK